MPWINEDRCTGCADCVEACPEDSIRINDEGKAVLNYRACKRLMCGKCRKICPEIAILPGFQSGEEWILKI